MIMILKAIVRLLCETIIWNACEGHYFKSFFVKFIGLQMKETFCLIIV